MKINSRTTLIAGTSLQGYLPEGTTYHQIVNVLGEPLDGGWDGKTKAQWTIEFHDGTVATIYDYKQESRPKEWVTEWHIGGNSRQAVDMVLDLFEEGPGGANNDFTAPEYEVDEAGMTRDDYREPCGPGNYWE